MQTAISYLMEPLLTQFFLMDAICQGFIDEAQRKETFCELARLFGIPLEEDTAVLYETATSPQYNRITDNASYERLCRTIEFAQHSGQDVGITAIDRKGEKFDPNLENAVMQGTADDGEPGTVCEVFQKGYQMGNQLLRPAMVKVVAD